MSKLEDTYTVNKELGAGAFSKVYHCTHKKEKKDYAVKVILKKDAPTDKDTQRLQNEVKILCQLDHPNIIHLKELFEDNERLCLVVELVTGGELFEKIIEKGTYTEKDSQQVVCKIIQAIDYLHSKGIAHRDLKPENLLLKDKKGLEIMISDFGLSRIVSEATMMKTACGTPYYVAPEVLQAQGYDKEVDMWSIGVITYLLLCGFPPFYGDSLPQLFEIIMKGSFDFPAPYWNNISSEAKDFIKKLLSVNPQSRLTPSQALQHPWLTGSGGSGQTLNLKEGTKKAAHKKIFGLF
eukprot:TRINITY_DN41129_c0_g1_i1.p1 TRINITY_DN41129_c0_g1~~TRINITY_DN41129_c0_g1_i1.p1  ORF type:complete len:294 (-),score=28.84 TRINITY_DN41129_c0_g1_i1:50-931(-)